MEQRTLGKTGLSVSVLGFGAAPTAYLKSEQQQAADMIRTLLDQGMNLIDTATSYPGSHAFIGEHLADRREGYVLVSKCGQKIDGLDHAAWTAPLITESVDRALRDLKTDYLDVMLLHSCPLAILEAGDAFGALVAARDAGKIKYAGYSGDDKAGAYAASEMPDVAVIETSINIADQRNIDLVLRAAAANDIGVIAKRPIANAAWKDLADQRGLYKTYAKTYSDRLAKMGITPADLGFADRADWAEIALRFTLGQAGVTTAIVGTTNPDNAAANVSAAGKGPLSAEAVNAIRAAFAEADPDGRWAGQT